MSINEQRSYTEYNVTVPTTDFVVGFDFMDEGIDIVQVTLNDVDPTTLGYTILQINNTTYRFAPPVPEGIVRLSRVTDIDSMAHVFTEGAIFVSENMDGNFKQIRHAQQEVRDNFAKLRVDTDSILVDLNEVRDEAQAATQAANDAADTANEAAAAVNDKVSYSDLDNAVDAAVAPIKDYVALPYEPLKSYKLYERVQLENGDIVKSTVANNVINPNVDMTGWINPKIEQDKLNSRILTPFNFGAFGDGSSHKLSTMYATLSAAQAKYPAATSLNDEADWCAIQAFFFACHTISFPFASMGGNFVINKTTHYEGNFHKTNAIYGSVDLRVLEPVSLDYFLKWEGYFSQMLGSIRCHGYQSNSADARTRVCKNGVLLGIEGGTGNVAQGAYLNSITADNLSGHAFVFGQNAHFSRVGFIRGGYCGSATGTGSTTAHYTAANWAGKTDNLSGQLSGSSTITVDYLPPQQATGLEIFGDNSNTYVLINNEEYLVYAVNRTDSTIQVVPQITTTETTGTLKYIYGGMGISIGNNTANTWIGVAQSITCGIGFRFAAVYATHIGTLATESNGIAVSWARRNNPNIGSQIDTAYFENNTFDHVENWSHPTHSGLVYGNTTALKSERLSSLFTFLTGGSRTSSNQYRKLCATIVIAQKKYSLNDWYLTGNDLTDSLPVKIFATNGQTTAVSCDEKLFSHYGKGSIIYCFQSLTTTNGAPTGNIVLNAGVGQTINGGASVTYVGSDYQQPLMLVISRTAANTLKVNAINKAEKSATAAYDPPSIPADDRVSTTVTLSGAVLGDDVSASINRSRAGLQLNPYVSAPNTVTVDFINGTAAAIDLASLTIRVKII